jgi:tripartite-type tricarboxylate transporter receptor subunit TctC
VMPPQTPADIVNKVYQELAAVLKAPDLREKFLAQGALASGMPPAQFAAFVRAEIDKWAKVTTFAKVKVD